MAATILASRQRSTRPPVAVSDGATITLPCDKGSDFSVTLGGNRTLALSGDTDGLVFTLTAKQDGAGGRTLGMFTGTISWMGSAPAPNTAANKYTVYTFKRISSGVYLGWWSTEA